LLDRTAKTVGEMEKDTEERVSRRVAGRVKWFDGTKGFGFVVAEGEVRDILLHANVLRNFGQSSVADGAGIVLEVQDTPRGVQAIAVLEITQPDKGGLSAVELPDLIDRDLSQVPLLPARVKWFDRAKGFGFANLWGKPDDVFLHAEVLRRCGFADVAPGEAVGMRVVQGRRGLLAAEILSWDSVHGGPGVDADDDGSHSDYEQELAH
jgi:CspA family cold shock protein